ncbi:MAG: LexA family protein [Nodosilinea sp.]
MSLCPAERRLYDCLKKWFDSYGYAPTLREIKDEMRSLSMSFIQDLLGRLQQKGYIEKASRRARAIQLLSSELPLRGMIQAGYLTDHPECRERIRLEGDRYLAGDYALQVSGNSMIGAQIFDGDIVVIRPTSDLWAIRPGQTAVVWIDGEGTTLKHVFCQEGDLQVTLKPANPTHETRILDRDRIAVQGVMVGLHRYDDGLWLAAKSKD